MASAWKTFIAIENTAVDIPDFCLFWTNTIYQMVFSHSQLCCSVRAGIGLDLAFVMPPGNPPKKALFGWFKACYGRTTGSNSALCNHPPRVLRIVHHSCKLLDRGLLALCSLLIRCKLLPHNGFTATPVPSCRSHS